MTTETPKAKAAGATAPPAVPTQPPAPADAVLACPAFRVFRFKNYVITPQGTKVAGEDVEAARFAALHCGIALREVKSEDA